jgi:hypothetical protein
MSEQQISFGVLLADTIGGLNEIPMAVTGSWVKDGHRFSITREDLDDIVKNFEKRANGQVVVDFEHASERPEVARGGPVIAAGWIHALTVRDSGDGKKSTLYGEIEWEPDAKKMLRTGKYKFFSPAIDWGAVDKKAGRSKGATITSGALTNHPFLEELPAIQLSEKSGGKIEIEYVDQKNKEQDMSHMFHEVDGAKNDPFGMDGDQGMRSGLRREAVRRSEKIDEPGTDGKTTELRDDGETQLPRLRLRRMRDSDGVGKLGHHAVVGPDGRIAGFVSHGDLMAHAKQFDEYRNEEQDKGKPYRAGKKSLRVRRLHTRASQHSCRPVRSAEDNRAKIRRSTAAVAGGLDRRDQQGSRRERRVQAVDQG